MSSEVTQTDHADTLAEIDRALASKAFVPGLPPLLSAAFSAYQDAIYRQSNRLAIAILTLIFNSFVIAQFTSAPELVPLSADFRLIYSFGVLAFMITERRGLNRQIHRWALAILAVAPTLITAILCIRTTSTHTMSDVHTTTLIMLSVGLFFRQELAPVVITAGLSVLIYCTSVLVAPIIPPAEIPSLLLADLAIAAPVIGFSWLLARRDRLLFLLMRRETLRARNLAAQNQGLRQEVELDALTGIANRRCFERRLAEAWQSCLTAQVELSVIMIDVDHFKRFNDQYGHQGGDDCLRRIARAAAREIRAGDLIARYGGEEFAVIMPDSQAHIAGAMAERIRTAVGSLALPHAALGPHSHVSISLGTAALIPTPGTLPTHLIEVADQNLYNAKKHGRNRVDDNNTLWTPRTMEPQQAHR